jgi:hypothetical protein
MAEKIKALWAGEVPLPVAFWQYTVFYGFLGNIVATFAFAMLAAVGTSPWLFVPVFLLPVPYNVLMIVAVWRSAARYQGPQKWADLARIVTLLGMLLLSAT